ncbi:CRISPR-associated protein Cas1 [Desulfonatronospira thiodismutans ASO3-1]|uniref:CRISPR-associated endonuclease Cas1 n=1 Tax=Desulfonatronospira thiodismutans ASO3-1 TaxID=555779 RepID=D6SPU0_9BACT|nr:CRISPR-associated endonuclease Cas1 [Desulfonatronospira thiodismutans]EFI34766.1 CRISPR-associated protein Cas1 [Desulfonatronospira thiodismutans ASO3-1]
MERVYILEDGVYLRKNGDNLVLTKNRQTLEEIPVRNLKQMVLAGYAALSGSVLQVLMQNRVETVFLDKNWRFQGRLNVDEHKHVQRRIDQYRNLSDPEFVAESARILVHGKLENMARMLQVRGKRMKNQELLSKAAAIRALGKELGSLQDVELIRGCEGHASRLYFQVFDHLLTNKNFSFKGRSKRPPKDPVNALLSFVYTLLTNEVQTAVKTVGLDPYLGALHVIDYGRPSLACDLVEEWRAFLGDRLVLGLINKKSISVDDFVYRDVKDTDFVDEKDLRSKRPVEMKPAICRAFLQSYEKWMQQKILDPVSGAYSTQSGQSVHGMMDSVPH